LRVISPLSQQAFERSLHHAHTLEKHGKVFEAMASSLELQILATEQSRAIQQLGQQIQHHGRLMATLVEAALQKERYLPDTYGLIYQHHSQAILLHIEAIQTLLQSTKLLLRSYQKN
jgi:hypothetical protein